jgi:hypothetical protein
LKNVKRQESEFPSSASMAHVRERFVGE